MKRLETRPTILFIDGCGINHPRRAGLASIIGVTLDIPSVGVSKNVLCGTFDPPGRVGEASPLVHRGEKVGYVLFSRKGCRPIVVAPGHRVSVDGALYLAMRHLRDHKLPEPSFLAHLAREPGEAPNFEWRDGTIIKLRGRHQTNPITGMSPSLSPEASV